MFIQRALEPFYPHYLRAEGERFAAERRVHIVEADRWSVTAEIHGVRGSVESVNLDRIRDTLSAECTCDDWTTSGACAHIWAVAVIAARHNYLTGYGSQRLRLLQEPDSERLRSLPAAPPPWKQQLQSLTRFGPLVPVPAAPPREKSVFYCLQASYYDRGFSLSLAAAERKLNGEWGKLRDHALSVGDLPHLPESDREILGLLSGNRTTYTGGSGLLSGSDVSGRMLDYLLTHAQEGQLLWGNSRQPEQATPLPFDPGPPWHCHLSLEKAGHHWELSAVLQRGDVAIPVKELRALTLDGFVATRSTIARVETGVAVNWARELRARGAIRVPESHGLDFARELIDYVPATAITWPAGLSLEEVQRPLVPNLRFRPPKPGASLCGVLTFHYGDQVFDEKPASGRGVRQLGPSTYLVRDLAAEADARNTLRELGLKRQEYYHEVVPLWEIKPKRFPDAVRELVSRGWTVESEGRVMRPSTKFHLEITSGIDWFGLKGNVEFDGQFVELPELLKSIERGKNLVRLGDGSFGLLPEDLLSRYGVLLEMGEAVDGEVRYQKSQASLLDIYLAELPEVQTDQLFEKARQELKTFSGVGARREPPGFQGTLRDYQRAGLGWLQFLRRFGFGGCLADDMGVGKTPQVLAQLESVRGHGPSLAVVPRSLIYNWQQEAARFTPRLRVLDYAHPERAAQLNFADHDLVLTTYGILRRDIGLLREHQFEYVILDEAQAIKNASSESAKAARLLRARHRLALSGTPIENHLGELWSLFEFLNPGMLGGSRLFHSLAQHNSANASEHRARIAQALRPFILRRTKAQVARELPERIEQTIYCELDTRQQALYDELKVHYREKLLSKATKVKGGLSKSKIQILEALLRLRQAACHPALIDPAQYAGASSSKLDTLMENLAQVLDEGHKTLVFSQFTSMLSLVRARLDAAHIAYCYLDGKTKDRQSVVETFQRDDGPKLFLISLKAGGVGLNLTAAEYVFLLDPWWNPAAEAQAIDRAHRIGQSRTVLAYRLIAKGTVEERVLELQAGKRELAEAILGENRSLMGNLTGDDLDLLLS